MCAAVEQEYNKLSGRIVVLYPEILRKLVNYVCVNQIIPVASSYHGYWLCEEGDFDNQVKSLEERAHAILKRAAGLKEMKYGNYKANTNDIFPPDEI